MNCFGSILLLAASAVSQAQASSEHSHQLKLDIVSRGEDLMVFVVNDGAEDIEIHYPFSLSFDGGGAGDLELFFQPVKRSRVSPEGRLCAAVQQNASALPRSRILWAGTLFGRRFDKSYVKAAFCLKKGVYDVSAKLHFGENSLARSVSSAPYRVLFD